MKSELEVLQSMFNDNFDELRKYCVHNLEANDRLVGLKLQHESIIELIKEEKIQDIIKMIDNFFHNKRGWVCLENGKPTMPFLEIEKELKSQLNSQETNPITTKVEVGDYKSSAVGNNAPVCQGIDDEHKVVDTRATIQVSGDVKSTPDINSPDASNARQKAVPSGLHTPFESKPMQLEDTQHKKPEGAKTLSDKMWISNGTFLCYSEEDVKEAIKKLQDNIKSERMIVYGGTEDDKHILQDSYKITQNIILEDIKNIFGKRLVEQ